MTPRVAVFPADSGACGSYRITWPAEALAAQGYPVAVDSPAIRTVFSERFSGPLPPPGVRLLDANCDTDVVVCQRPMHRQWLDVIPMLREKGIRVVVELDDLFDQIHRGNAAWRSAHEHWLADVELAQHVDRYGPQKVTHTVPGWSYCPSIEAASHRGNLRKAVSLADHLVVSTPALARHYGRWAKTVTVVRNRIPARYLAFGERHVEGNPATGRLRIGWTGSLASHPADPHVIGNGLANVRVPFEMLVVGPGDGVSEAFRRRVDGATGWVHLDLYPAAYAHLDIAICPLEQSKFNASKSGLKAIEAAAVGAIPVMSPSPEYLALHALGVGLVARTPAEWTRHIEMLLVSPIQRQVLRRRGLEVAAGMTVEGNAGEWWDAWTGQPAEAVEAPRAMADA